jgi:hypothetical protein
MPTGQLTADPIWMNIPQQSEEPMPIKLLQASRPTGRGRRSLAAVLAVAAILGMSFPARSQTVSATPPTAVPPTPNERLMRLVPETAGAWTMHSLRGARPGPDGQTTPSAEAEFRRQADRVTLTVADAGMMRTSPPPAPVESTTVDGSERLYGEGGATVRETVRRIDGRVDVALMRADGIVVTVQGTRVPAAELKALALAVRPLPR